jgi:hypothetical protein
MNSPVSDLLSAECWITVEVWTHAISSHPTIASHSCQASHRLLPSSNNGDTSKRWNEMHTRDTRHSWLKAPLYSKLRMLLGMIKDQSKEWLWRPGLFSCFFPYDLKKVGKYAHKKNTDHNLLPWISKALLKVDTSYSIFNNPIADVIIVRFSVTIGANIF